MPPSSQLPFSNRPPRGPAPLYSFASLSTSRVSHGGELCSDSCCPLAYVHRLSSVPTLRASHCVDCRERATLMRRFDESLHTKASVRPRALCSCRLFRRRDSFWTTHATRFGLCRGSRGPHSKRRRHSHQNDDGQRALSAGESLCRPHTSPARPLRCTIVLLTQSGRRNVDGRRRARPPARDKLWWRGLGPVCGSGVSLRNASLTLAHTRLSSVRISPGVLHCEGTQRAAEARANGASSLKELEKERKRRRDCPLSRH